MPADVAQDFSPARRVHFAALKRCATLALLLLAAAGCETLISDMATRLAYAVRDGAARLSRSRSETLVLSVAWRSWPDGCPGGYRVEWNADNADKTPGVGVECTSTRHSYGTTYARNFVKVTKALTVTKEKGEPVTIALRKRSDGAIEVVALQ
jgi:hypothetical protein